MNRTLPARPYRMYRRRTWREAPFVALDFETTGLDLSRDAVISFGTVPVVGGQILLKEARYREVSPAVPPTAESITIHHLRPVDLRSSPSLEDVRGELAIALQRRYLLTWVGEIEAAFLSKVFGGRPRWWIRRTIDVWQLARLAERLEGKRTDVRELGLASTAARYGVPVEETHHALDDALMTGELFLVLAAKLSDRGYRTVGSLLRETRRSRSNM